MDPGVAQTLTSMSAPPLQCAGLSRITWDTTLDSCFRGNHDAGRARRGYRHSLESGNPSSGLLLTSEWPPASEGRRVCTFKRAGELDPKPSTPPISAGGEKPGHAL